MNFTKQNALLVFTLIGFIGLICVMISGLLISGVVITRRSLFANSMLSTSTITTPFSHQNNFSSQTLQSQTPSQTIEPPLFSIQPTDGTSESSGSISSELTQTPIVPTVIYINPTEPTYTISPIIFDNWCVPWHTEANLGVVTRVIDGVTIEVEIDDEIRSIRYLGLAQADENDYPDSSEIASNANIALVEGQKVLLVKDPAYEDSGDLLFRYVLSNGVFVNRDLVQNGFVLTYMLPSEISCSDTLIEAELAAINNQRGIFAPSPTPTRAIMLNPTNTIAAMGEIVITKIQPKGTGWQDPEEYIEFKNVSNFPIQMKGWELSDLSGHTYIFPNFIINPGNYCRVFTNEYHPEKCGLSFESLSQIWNELEECAYLHDLNGLLIDEFCYGW